MATSGHLLQLKPLGALSLSVGSRTWPTQCNSRMRMRLGSIAVSQLEVGARLRCGVLPWRHSPSSQANPSSPDLAFRSSWKRYLSPWTPRANTTSCARAGACEACKSSPGDWNACCRFQECRCRRAAKKDGRVTHFITSAPTRASQGSLVNAARRLWIQQMQSWCTSVGCLPKRLPGVDTSTCYGRLALPDS
jgi:hypothetical protein